MRASVLTCRILVTVFEQLKLRGDSSLLEARYWQSLSLGCHLENTLPVTTQARMSQRCPSCPFGK